MAKQKTIKEKFSSSILMQGGFYVKLTLTIFLAALFLLIFFLQDGIIFFEPYKYCYKYNNNSFAIHVIDVENGDAILIKLPNNQTMLIDTGEERYYKRVESYLKQYNYYQKTNKIDYLVLSHSDSDHVGNAANIIEKFNVKSLIRPKLYSIYESENFECEQSYNVSDSEIYDSCIKSAYKKNCKMMFASEGLSIDAGDCKIEFLSPKLDFYSDMNNYSAVIMITYNEKKFLFMGDAETSIEKVLIDEYGEKLRADVLKVGHHGSKTSSSQKFLDNVKPEYAIVSSSGTSTVLPSYEVIDRLKANNIQILATGNMGNFAISLTSDKIVYSKAERPDNILALLLSIFIILILIVWKNPFQGLKFSSICNKK